MGATANQVGQIGIKFQSETLPPNPGSSVIDKFHSSDVDVAFAVSRPARHCQDSRNPFRAGDDFRGFLVHTFATACQLPRPPSRAPTKKSNWYSPTKSRRCHRHRWIGDRAIANRSRLAGLQPRRVCYRNHQQRLGRPCKAQGCIFSCR